MMFLFSSSWDSPAHCPRQVENERKAAEEGRRTKMMALHAKDQWSNVDWSLRPELDDVPRGHVSPSYYFYPIGSILSNFTSFQGAYALERGCRS